MAITEDTVFVGATRPTMILGVSYEAVIFNGIFTAIVFLGVGNPLFILAALPIHAVCYGICAADPRTFRFLALWLKTKGRCMNRGYWKCSSSAPLVRRRYQEGA